MQGKRSGLVQPDDSSKVSEYFQVLQSSPCRFFNLRTIKTKQCRLKTNFRRPADRSANIRSHNPSNNPKDTSSGRHGFRLSTPPLPHAVTRPVPSNPAPACPTRSPPDGRDNARRMPHSPTRSPPDARFSPARSNAQSARKSPPALQGFLRLPIRFRMQGGRFWGGGFVDGEMGFEIEHFRQL